VLAAGAKAQEVGHCSCGWLSEDRKPRSKNACLVCTEIPALPDNVPTGVFMGKRAKAAPPGPFHVRLRGHHRRTEGTWTPSTYRRYVDTIPAVKDMEHGIRPICVDAAGATPVKVGSGRGNTARAVNLPQDFWGMAEWYTPCRPTGFEGSSPSPPTKIRKETYIRV
jgi:hypothetical protein